METIKESATGEAIAEFFDLWEAKFPKEMQERWQERTDAKVRLLYECDKGTRRVSPRVWQMLKEIRWVDIQCYCRRGLAPIDRHREREHSFELVSTVLCRAWASKAQSMRDRWKNSQSEEMVDDKEDGSEDDDDKTIPTSNVEEAEQSECWENMDYDFEENVDQEVPRAVEDPKSETGDIFFEFNDPGLDGTSSLETTAWRVAPEPFVEEFCSVEGEHPDRNFNLDKREEIPTSSDHIFGKPPKKPGGTRILDKALSGEYVLGRPPKKPGGTLRLF